MPTVTFLGPFATRRRPDNAEAWLRRQPTEVSQSWLNQWRSRVNDPKYFLVKGDEGETVDFNDDGIPDSGWTKKDITAWIKDNGGTTTGYNTKAKLLGTVDTILNPPAPEPVVEKVIEETIVEDLVDETLGVEE